MRPFGFADGADVGGWLAIAEVVLGLCGLGEEVFGFGEVFLCGEDGGAEFERHDGEAGGEWAGHGVRQ